MVNYSFDDLVSELLTEKELEKLRYIPDKFAKLGDWRSTPYLGKILIDVKQSPILRNECAESLGKQGDPNAMKYLDLTLNDEDSDLRRTVVWSIGQIGTEDGVNILRKVFNDTSIQVRKWIPKSLGRIRSDNVIECLKDFYESDYSKSDVILPEIPRGIESQIKRCKRRDLEFWAAKCTEILRKNKNKIIAQAFSSLLLRCIENHIVMEKQTLRHLLEIKQNQDILTRPNLLLAMGYTDDLEFLKQNLEFDETYVALGIAGDIEFLENELAKNDLSEKRIIAILKGLGYDSNQQTYRDYINHEILSIRLEALEQYAKQKNDMDILLKNYKLGRGKNRILYILRHYGDDSLSIYENETHNGDKAARQAILSALSSINMRSNVKNKESVYKILEFISVHEKVWHMRRDARNLLTYYK